ncbi:MAG: AAA family ATPase [Elusimicrobia bacterium]|nr:AAA family ATPase [Elusimicrobiota bacterium]
MKEQSKKALRFIQVRMENWRNFLATDVQLQSRAFLVGPNASGKSNFLDVFRFLHDIVAVGGGFQQAVIKRGGVSRLRCLSARRYPDVVIHVQLGNNGQSPQWQYELHFSQDNRQRPVVKKEKITRQGSILFDRPLEEDKKDPERLTQTYLQQMNVNQEFRDIADFFESVHYLHIVPQLVREPNRSLGQKNDPYGGDFLEQVARTPEKTQKARLRRIGNALSVAVPQLVKIELIRDPATGVPHLRGKYEHWRPRGAWQQEDQFSDGTLRLMGLLWAALDGSGPLLLEEPELSLHPEVVRVLPQVFARIQRRLNRQILISTHSSDLLRDDGIGLDETLLLQPSRNGTMVRSADNSEEIKQLLNGGLTIAEAVIPMTRPKEAEQLLLFGDL